METMDWPEALVTIMFIVAFSALAALIVWRSR